MTPHPHYLKLEIEILQGSLSLWLGTTWVWCQGIYNSSTYVYYPSAKWLDWNDIFRHSVDGLHCVVEHSVKS